MRVVCRLVCLVAPALAALGCTQPAPGTTFDGVRALYVDTFAIAAGDVTTPRALTAASYSALVERDGEFTTFLGAEGDGSVTITGVPEGPYYYETVQPPSDPPTGYQAFRGYWVTSERELDFGLLFIHRPDTEPVTQASELRLEGALSRPFQVWTADDQGNVTQPLEDYLTIVSVGAGICGLVDPASDLDGSMVDGMTALSGTNVDTQSALSAVLGDAAVVLADASKGDEIMVVHHVQHHFGDLLPAADPGLDPWAAGLYHMAEATGVAAPVTMIDGEDTTIAADFSALPTISTSLEVGGEAFGALLTDALSADALKTVSASVSVAWEPLSDRVTSSYFGEVFYGSAGALVSPQEPLCFPDVDGLCDASCVACDPTELTLLPGDLSATIAFGNPHGDAGLYWESVRYGFFARATDPADGSGDWVGGHLSTARPVGSSGPMVPMLGFVSNITIDGRAAPLEGVLEGVGTSPVIAFDPPTLGAATYYNVSIWSAKDVVDDQGAVLRARFRIANIATTEPRVVVPPGILDASTPYLVQVRAISVEGWSPSAPSRVGSLVSHSSEIGAGYFKP